MLGGRGGVEGTHHGVPRAGLPLAVAVRLVLRPEVQRGGRVEGPHGDAGPDSGAPRMRSACGRVRVRMRAQEPEQGFECWRAVGWLTSHSF